MISLRENKNYTQKRLAEESRVSQQFINALEKGNKRPSPENAKIIARILDFDWVLFFENDKEEKSEEETTNKKKVV